MSGVALVFPYFRTRAATEMLFPPLGLAALAAQLRGRRRGEGLRLHLQLARASARRPRRLPARHRRHLLHGQPDPQHPARRRGAAPSPAGRLLVAGGPLPTVFPGRFRPHVDARLPRRGRPELPARSAATISRAAATPGDLGELPSTPTPGCSCGPATCTSTTRRCTTARGARRLSPARPQRLRPRRLPARVARPPAAGHLAARHPRLPLQLRLLLAAGLRQRRAAPRPRQRCSPRSTGIVRLGYDSLWIADDIFTLDRGYLEAFCRRIAPLGMTWTCLSRANGIGPPTARS